MKSVNKGVPESANRMAGRKSSTSPASCLLPLNLNHHLKQ